MGSYVSKSSFVKELLRGAAREPPNSKLAFTCAGQRGLNTGKVDAAGESGKTV